MAKIDLHIHSNYSGDGEFSVKEILYLCKQIQMKYLSITDHNTVRGVSEVLTLAPQMGMQAISGVELDCTHEGQNFHLLGYHFDPTYSAFAEIEQSILRQEQNAAEEKIILFEKETEISVCVEEVLAAASGGIVTGELIAEILLNKENAKEYKALWPYLYGGARSDNPFVNFYWDYFSQGKLAYVPITYISLEEGIALLHAAGGIAVLAHPGQNLKGNYDFLKQLIKSGMDGIEAYSSYHGRIEAGYFENQAQQNKLFVTCGSDFHGKTKPSISLCEHRADENMQDIAAALKMAGILRAIQ